MNGQEQASILEFRVPSAATAFNTFKRSYSVSCQSSDTHSKTTSADGEPEDNGELEDNEDRPSGVAKHEKMVHMSKAVVEAWKQMTDDDKTQWKEEADKINNEKNSHKPEDCFMQVSYLCIGFSLLNYCTGIRRYSSSI